MIEASKTIYIMNRLITLLALLLLSNTLIFAQEEATEEETPFDVTGFVDVYYQYNTNGAALGTTSFTGDHNSFSLGMAKLGLSKEVGKVAFGVDLGFGPRADAANGYSGTSFGPVQQLYVAYSPSDKVTLTAGNFEHTLVTKLLMQTEISTIVLLTCFLMVLFTTQV